MTTTTSDRSPTGLQEWIEHRVSMLLEDGATVHMTRGYADYAAGREPDYASVVGEPFAANHYHEGYGLAAYELGAYELGAELGNATTTKEEVAA